MRTAVQPRSQHHGSVLAYTLVIAGIISLALLTYLGLIRDANHSTQRSQCWNECVAVMEAGIEDALTHLNSSGVTNLAVDGWTASGGKYCLQRVVASNYYVVSISTSVPPVITATGFVQIPLFLDKYV